RGGAGQGAGRALRARGAQGAAGPAGGRGDRRRGARRPGRVLHGLAAVSPAVRPAEPLILVIEDLHRADPALLDFLEQLLDQADTDDLLVVVTARPELLDRRPGWGAGGANATTISLAPLDDQQTAVLLAALLGRSMLPAEVQSLLLERAGGNPLYAEEFVRLLTDRGLLTRRGRLAPASEL